MKNFRMIVVSAAFFCLCACREAVAPPLTLAEPASWHVGPAVSEATADGHYTAKDGTNLPFMQQDFVIRNTGGGTALRLYTINFLSPDGTVLSDALRSALFSVERSKVSDERGTVVTGFMPVDGNHFENRYPDGTAIVAPLCPLDAEGKCKKGFDTTEHNTALTIRVTYRGLTPAQYAALTADKLKSDGTYHVELCVNDYANPIESASCTQGNSFRIPIYRYPEAPPKPIIGLRYWNPITGYKDHRVIKDRVNMDVSLSCPRKEGADEATCNKIISDTVSGPDTITANDFRNQCCAANWEDRYCLKYRWEMVETPTPLTPETRIELGNIPLGGEGNWYEACGELDPTIASFKGYMITPTPEGKYYKVSIQAITIDKQTPLESDVTEKIDAPNIIPAARVMVQLTWKEGSKENQPLDSQEVTQVDLDLHLVKRKGMNSCGIEVGRDGLLCTLWNPPTVDFGSPTHDDCHFSDPGGCEEGKMYLGEGGCSELEPCGPIYTSCNECEDGEAVSQTQTLAWHAFYDIDNTWGGVAYTSPETINFGPLYDSRGGPVVNGKETGDGIPDVTPFDDEYLVIVNYNTCWDLKNNDPSICESGGKNYNVHAKVEIFVDGKVAPRAGTQDDKSLSRTEFVIRPYEWIVIGTFTWDGALVPSTPGWSGDAVVHDVPTTHTKICRFRSSHCHNVAIWDYAAYETWVKNPTPVKDEFGGGDGECYDYGERE